MTALRPTSAAETAELVAWAAAEGATLELAAGGSKQRLGRPVQAAHRLDLSALSGILDYDPSELVLTARAATPLAAIEALIAEHGQMLAFEPPDWRGLLQGGGEPTLGGAIACNLAGPRRVRAGAARDHLLGFSAVNGRGEAWKAGGKVVKNVTGYDLCKLQAGAYGTLSVLTELSVRVLPRPESECSVVWYGLSDDAAMPALAAAMNTPHEVAAAAHLPAAAARRSGVAGIAQAEAQAKAKAGAQGGTQGGTQAGAGSAVTVVRLEGPSPSVDHRARALEAISPGCVRLSGQQSAAFWSEVSAVQPLLGRADTVVWRVCPTPSAAAALLRAMHKAHRSAAAFFDWGGGLLWLSLDPDEAGADCGAGALRAALAPLGGHATLIRASEAARRSVAVFEPPAASLEALTRRVKAGFDPLGILNPGRMQQGF